MVSDAVFQQTFEVMLPFVIVGVAWLMDRGGKVIWRPIMCFMDTLISLVVGVHLLGNPTWSTLWFMGIFMFCFAVLLSVGGAWLALNFGKTEG